MNIFCECGTHIKQPRRGVKPRCMGCYSRRLPPDESAFNAVWNDYVQQTKRRGREWGITKDEARRIFTSPCSYCGVPPSAIKKIPFGRGSFSFNGIDRIDNSVGYILENCTPCCRTCNIMKQGMSVAEFRIHVNKIYVKLKTGDAPCKINLDFPQRVG